uniref:Uncharacterized protein n=1 Tax=Mustela putorius furo TaxID=9669 RepID=M3Z2Q7_MUSPF
ARPPRPRRLQTRSPPGSRAPTGRDPGTGRNWGHSRWWARSRGLGRPGPASCRAARKSAQGGRWRRPRTRRRDPGRAWAVTLAAEIPPTSREVAKGGSREAKEEKTSKSQGGPEESASATQRREAGAVSGFGLGRSVRRDAVMDASMEPLEATAGKDRQSIC